MKARIYKIKTPVMKHREGWKCPKTELRVSYNAQTLGVPWKVIRPMVVCAFKHVQREAFNDLKMDFIVRNKNNFTTLYLHKSHRRDGDWWGRNMGMRSRVFIGALREEPHDDTYDRFTDMPEHWVKDWRERLVSLIAHELWHRWQRGTGKQAETMCETVAIDAVDAYRKQMGYTFNQPTKNEDTDYIEPVPTGAGTDQRMHLQLSVQPQ